MSPPLLFLVATPSFRLLLLPSQPCCIIASREEPRPASSSAEHGSVCSGISPSAVSCSSLPLFLFLGGGGKKSSGDLHTRDSNCWACLARRPRNMRIPQFLGGDNKDWFAGIEGPFSGRSGKVRLGKTDPKPGHWWKSSLCCCPQCPGVT